MPCLQKCVCLYLMHKEERLNQTDPGFVLTIKRKLEKWKILRDAGIKDMEYLLSWQKSWACIKNAGHPPLPSTNSWAGLSAVYLPKTIKGNGVCKTPPGGWIIRRPGPWSAALSFISVNDFSAERPRCIRRLKTASHGAYFWSHKTSGTGSLWPQLNSWKHSYSHDNQENTEVASACCQACTVKC